jgi:hypothetical protein
MKTLAPVDFKAVAAEGCFVYCYLRSRNTETAKAGTPYYIGIAYAKDLRQRAQRPFRKEHSCTVPGNPALIRVLRSGLDYNQVCQWERFYIAHYGHKLTGGILWNINGGGEGCYDPTGVIGAKISKSKAGRPCPQHQRERISRSLTGRTQPKELVERRKASRQGYRHASDVIAKIGATNRATKLASEDSARKAAEVGIPHDVWQGMSKQNRKHAAKYKERAEACGYTLVEWLGMSRGERCSASKRRYFSQLAA